MDYFETYDEWRDAMTNRCGLPLTATYCDERIQALQNGRDASTKDFVKLYGSAYLDRVVSWFERARRDAG